MTGMNTDNSLFLNRDWTGNLVLRARNEPSHHWVTYVVQWSSQPPVSHVSSHKTWLWAAPINIFIRTMEQTTTMCSVTGVTCSDEHTENTHLSLNFSHHSTEGFSLFELIEFCDSHQLRFQQPQLMAKSYYWTYICEVTLDTIFELLFEFQLKHRSSRISASCSRVTQKWSPRWSGALSILLNLLPSRPHFVT